MQGQTGARVCDESNKSSVVADKCISGSFECRKRELSRERGRSRCIHIRGRREAKVTREREREREAARRATTFRVVNLAI